MSSEACAGDGERRPADRAKRRARRLQLTGAMTILLAGGLPVPPAAAGGKAQLEAFLQGLHTLESAFEQTVLNQEDGRTGFFSGMFFLQRPGRFRWEYTSPYSQSIIADGRDLWIVDRDLDQVTELLQRSALKGTPALLLAEDVEVEDEFEVIDIGTSQGLEWVELIPRGEESQFIRILLAFAGRDLRRMEMADKFGQVTRFRFFDTIRNPDLDAELFRFDKPPGFDVFEH